ncbi:MULTISPECIES: succinate dehydrogenase, cytochrome b556 subunit [Afifella]|uniref:succinate dehydrogenase, cytochrome b556 subunit n=1 Tax=Afifella TaxID=643217 RepID=UPI000FE3A368|nr:MULTISPECIES: succinate dehydrogenase, cytochrome b556 subunit [Afifella]MCT8268573.1 succinate dehydrogenase, cytochrome b556 subunit [Afifella sp. JA880]
MKDLTERQRPLSPFTQIYRWPITMVTSILHRITGIGLYIGSLFFIGWIVALALGPEAYGWATWFFGSPFGWLVLFGYTWVLMQHLMGAIRHFIWDTGAGYEKPVTQKLAWASLAGSVGLTALLWIVILLAL